MSWVLENMFVRGKYLNRFIVSGTVELSRIAYGGDIKHTVVLDNPIEVFGAMRERVILSHTEIDFVADNTE
jgi:hypothetical protein